MRWKLASGSVVSKSNQPTHKDFDKLVVNWVSCDEYTLLDADIQIINPSTHLLRKSYNGQLYLGITPKRRATTHPYRGFWKGCNCYTINPLHAGINQLENSIDYNQDFMRDNCDRRSGTIASMTHPESHHFHPNDWNYLLYYDAYYNYEVNDYMRVSVWLGPPECTSRHKLILGPIDYEIER